MRAATFPPSADLGSKLDAIGARVISGSRHPAIRARAADAVRETGGDAWAAFERVYGELVRSGVRLPDPGHDAGEDRIEPADVTLSRMAGDCDDWTVLVLALARALGFRGSIVTLSAQPDDGPPIPLHVFATIERLDGADVVADASEGLPLGSDPLPTFSTATLREVWPVEGGGPALGFIGGVFQAIASIVTSGDNRRNARDARAGAEAQAAAVNNQSASAERIAEREARVGMAAIGAQQTAALVNARLRVRDQDLAQLGTQQAFAFLREMAPVGVALAALGLVMPVVKAAAGVR